MKTKSKSKAQTPMPEGPGGGPRSTIESSASLPRHGKIARLPAEIRESLNRALAQGVSGPQVLEWLNGLPGTQTVLRELFDGQPISLQNLSQWRRGGFRDWLLKQEAKEVLAEFAVHHRSLALLQLPEKVTLWLGSRLVAMAGWVDRQSPEESWPVVHQMIRDVATLRRADYQIRQQQLKEQAQRKLNHKELRDWALQPEVLASLCKEAAAKQKDKTNAFREATFRLIGGLSGIDPEDLLWEANKRGITVDQLIELRDVESPRWRGGKTESEVAAAVQVATALSAGKEKAGAADGKKKGPRLRSGAASASAQKQVQRDKSAGKVTKGGTEPAANQGPTKQIKADKGKSKCYLPAAAKPLSAETPDTKGQTPTRTCASAKSPPSSETLKPKTQTPTNSCEVPAQPEPVGQVGRGTQGGATRKSESPATSAAAPAPEQQAVEPCALTRPEMERILDLCDCGARGNVRVEDCPSCQTRPPMGRFYCGCHKVWEHRHGMHNKETK